MTSLLPAVLPGLEALESSICQQKPTETPKARAVSCVTWHSTSLFSSDPLKTLTPCTQLPFPAAA